MALGHLNYDDVLHLAKLPDSNVKITGNKKRLVCQICIIAKATRRYSRGPASRFTRALGRIHIDIMGGGEVFAVLNPGSTLPKNGFTPFNYVMIITDDATRFRWVYGLLTREHEEIAEKLRQWAAHIKAQGFSMPAFYPSDNEFGSGLIMGLLTSWGSKFEPSNPDSPWQNGAAERANRIVLERARAMLIGACMGDEWWYEAIRAAIQLINLSPTSTALYNDPTPGGTTDNNDISPLQTRIPQTALYNVIPKVEHFLPFGSVVHVTRHGSNKPENKVATRTTIGRVVGYASPTNYLIYDPEKDDEFMSGDITPSGLSATAPVPGGAKPKKSITISETDDGVNDIEPSNSNSDWVIPARTFKVLSTRRVKRAQQEGLPQTYRDAVTGPEAQFWRRAMQQEIDGFESKFVYELIPATDVPENLKPIPGKWVYLKKTNVDGSIRYKARWVIRGNITNGHAALWGDSTAPVAMAQTKLILFAAAAHYGWRVAQADAVMAFLNGKLDHDVYMRQPTGFEKGEKGHLVCRLRQALYGLVPAARIWYDSLCKDLKALGFRISDFDAALFIHSKIPNLFVLAHVDDFAVTGANSNKIIWVMEAMGRKFEIKDLGDIKTYLGMEVTQSDQGIKLTQLKFIDQLLEENGMQDCNPALTPLPPGLSIDDEPDPSIDIKRYQGISGGAQWLASNAHPEIARAASLLAQFNSRPTRKAQSAQQHLLSFLKGARTTGIVFERGSGALPCPIAYSDSDWGGSLSPGRKSCTGYVFLINSAPISWKSRRQSSVALSSNEAEYLAASDTAREAEWLRRLINDMGLYGDASDGGVDSIPFYMDSKGARDLVSSSITTQRSKHIDVRYHYVRDIAARKIIEVIPIGTESMAADGFTKSLAMDRSGNFGDKLAYPNRCFEFFFFFVLMEQGLLLDSLGRINNTIKGLYTSHLYSSFCVELRTIPAGKPHVVYLAVVQVASRGTPNI